MGKKLGLLCMFAALLCMFAALALISCSGADSGNQFDRDAEEMEAFLDDFASRMYPYRDRFQDALRHPERSAKPKYDPSRYKLFKKIMLYHDQGSGVASVFATGLTPIGKSVWERLHVLESFEDDQKQIADQNPEFIKAVFFYFTDGTSSIYPPMNVVSFIPPGFNFRTFAPQTFKALEIGANAGRTHVYGPPYIDIAGQGYLFTLRLPIDVDNTWVGYLGIDLDLGYLKNEFVEKENRRLLVLTGTGLLLSASKGATELLGIGELDNFLYLKQIPFASIPPEVDLLKHRDPEIISLAQRLLVGKDFEFTYKGRRRDARVRTLGATGWLLVEIR